MCTLHTGDNHKVPLHRVYLLYALQLVLKAKAHLAGIRA